MSQVGQAVTQMDQVTQRNAALVEQMAAAASSLKAQAQDLVQMVAVFKLAGNVHSSLAKQAHAPPTHKPPPALALQARHSGRQESALCHVQTQSAGCSGSARCTGRRRSSAKAPTVTASAKADEECETF